MRPRTRIALSVLAALAAFTPFGVSPLSASVADGASTYPVVSAFSKPDGAGFWLVLVGGGVSGSGKAGRFGDASSVWGNGQIVNGVATPTGRGYWLGASDGGVFAYGDAHFYGSMGGAHLNQPVRSLSPTKSGKGYWLVARDGGVFTFGDARFYGSTGGISLSQPIVGMTASSRGYRLVARDGGIFDFGDAPFYGSLPGRGVQITDAVGMASAPTNKGYWIARSDGHVYAFGTAHSFGNYVASACDPVAAIIANPRSQGYRLVMQSGATVPFGSAPGGSHRTGKPFVCSASLEVVTPRQIGPLQLGVSTEADVRAHLGAPDATATGNFGAALPNYRSLGYDCSKRDLPGGRSLNPYPLPGRPQTTAVLCRTIYFLNTETQTLAGFNTTSTRYATPRGTTVGTTIGEAQRRERRPFYPLGCFVGIRLGEQTDTPQMFLFATGRNLADQVGEMSIDSSTNSVGVLFC